MQRRCHEYCHLILQEKRVLGCRWPFIIIDVNWEKTAALNGLYCIAYPPANLVVPPPIVYIMDTGIDANHPELYRRVTRVFDYFEGELLYNCDYHCTHVAGIIAGTNVGGNPYANLRDVRILDCDGQGDTSNMAVGMNAIIAECNRNSSIVINLSLGGQGTSSMVDNLFSLARKSCNAIIVVAAGNNAQDACQDYPSGSPYVIATAASDINDTYAFFSNYGSCTSMIAPGVDIVSAWNASSYMALSGTSMASPHVAGISSYYAGLYNSFYKNQTLASGHSGKFADVVKSILQFTSSQGDVLTPTAHTSSHLAYVNEQYLQSPVTALTNFTFSPVFISTGLESFGDSKEY